MSNRSLKPHPCRPLFRPVLLGCLVLTVGGCNWVKLLSVSSTGEQGISQSESPALSADGRFVAFNSYANNLVDDDIGVYSDIFVHDTINGTTSRVSVDGSGDEGNADSYLAAISGDGRYVAFISEASNLVAGDTNNVADVFVHDATTGTTERINVSSEGNEVDSAIEYSPAISSDGRFVAFISKATNLVAGDSNGTSDVFVRDRATGTTTLASVSSAGTQGNYDIQDIPAISSDGRYVAFTSHAGNLVDGDTNGNYDAFVHDRTAGTTTRVSVNSAGNQGNAGSFVTAISNNGRYVAFTSAASNLVVGDTNNTYDIFLHDRNSGTTTRVSVDSAGKQGNSDSSEGLISGDGRYIAFNSAASNLVVGDTNNTYDIFVHDRVSGTTSRASVDAQGAEANEQSYLSSISADGRYVGFQSYATNLVAGDSNISWDVFIKAIPEVTLTSVIPNKLPIGATTPVTIAGKNFLSGVMLGLNGAQLSNIVIVNENTITAKVTVVAGTPTGAQTLSVGLPGTGPGQLTGSSADCINCVTFTAAPPRGC